MIVFGYLKLHLKQQILQASIIKLFTQKYFGEIKPLGSLLDLVFVHVLLLKNLIATGIS